MKSEYRILYGEKGKKYYALSSDFWKYIQNQLKNNKFKTKRWLVRYINQSTNGEITQRALENWFYRNRKPKIVDNFEIAQNHEDGCKHGSSYFCLACNLNKINIHNCPVPLCWTTIPKGILYIYDKYWSELKYNIDNSHKYNGLLSSLYGKVKVDPRTIRNWRVNKNLPKIYNDDHFLLSPHNSYLLGLFFSDGHLRNNGSDFSYTYQTGSSNIFQGYWYPQLIQRLLPIFKNKKSLSNTYFLADITHRKTVFKSNLSSISPIFIKKIENYGIVQKRKMSKSCGYKKIMNMNFLMNLNFKHEFFQGLFDGDGTYGFRPSPIIDLATTPEIDYSPIIKNFNLIPTLTTQNKKKFISYSNRENNHLYMVRFAPGSLNRMSEEYTSEHIVKQLEFFLESAKHSIRPDKVHRLINIIKIITAKGYGEHRNCHPLQKEIRDLAIKSNFKDRTDLLEQQYPIKDNKYQPFIPEWMGPLCSKSEAWDFFFKKENLVFKVDDKLKELDFSEGMPI